MKIDSIYSPINIGKLGEKGVLSIDFDVSDWLDLFPLGTFSVDFKPDYLSESFSLPPTQYRVADGVLTIDIEANITGKSGRASLGIRMLVGDSVDKRSAIIPVVIAESLPPAAGEMPEPVQAWIDGAVIVIGQAQTATLNANESTRIANEQELLREGAESDRRGAETSRNTAEGLRDSAETARKESEALRVAAEATRMGFKPMGAYNPANENKHGEWYTHEGGSYGYIWPEPSTGVPLTDTSQWQQIAEKGEKGDTGEQGDQGDQGTGLSVLGAKATVGELPSTGNREGDAWLVSGDLYIWSGTAWVNAGPFQGDKGDKGDKGDTEYSFTMYAAIDQALMRSYESRITILETKVTGLLGG